MCGLDVGEKLSSREALVSFSTGCLELHPPSKSGAMEEARGQSEYFPETWAGSSSNSWEREELKVGLELKFASKLGG